MTRQGSRQGALHESSTVMHPSPDRPDTIGVGLAGVSGMPAAASAGVGLVTTSLVTGLGALLGRMGPPAAAAAERRMCASGYSAQQPLARVQAQLRQQGIELGAQIPCK